MLGGSAHADDKTPAVAAAPAGAHEPLWLTYAAFRNDVFTELIPPIDDQGFTHDNVLVVRRQRGATRLGGGFVQRIITSRTDRRRWDLVELFATGERSWQHLLVTPVRAASLAVRAGPTFAGNLGGRYLQNGWHELTETGPTVDEGLANDYPGGHAYGFAIGARARASVGDAWQGYAYVGGQLSLGGTGATALESALGGSATREHVGGHVEVAITRYHVGDPYLALPGAYGDGFNVEWRVGVEVHWSRFCVGYEYRANEGGSGEPLGVIEF